MWSRNDGEPTMEHYVGLETRQGQSCEKAWLIPTLTRLARL